MAEVSAPWVEGEKIPDGQICQIFRPPPGIPTTYCRSSIIIGSKGAGKTTLFRYLKETHDGIAIHLYLATEFSSLTKQTGLGPLAYDCPSSLEPALIGKATSLLAVSIAARLIRKGVSPPTDLLSECLPEQMHLSSSVVTEDALRKIYRDVAAAPLEEFEHISNIKPLPRFVSALGELCQRVRGSLLLLLDRADMVLSPSLVPVLELLDQSSQYVALVAARPGLSGRSVADLCQIVIPGDTYAVHHLGSYPRSPEWVEFSRDAVAAQIGPRFEFVPEETKTTIINLARDSIRTGLEVFYRFHSVPEHLAEAEAVSTLQSIRENQLLAAQSTLQQHHIDIRRMIGDLRKEAMACGTRVQAPVVLSIEPRPPASLFDNRTRVHRFIETALRSGVLCMPEGTLWLPGSALTEVEIPPLLLWQKGDGLKSFDTHTPTVVHRHEAELLHGSGAPAAPPTIFVAYRMKFPESTAFRKNLEDSVRAYPGLNVLATVDGNLPPGAAWPKVIRNRIQKAKAVVADVTGMRPEVLFEVGFARGHGKPMIPVVSSPSDIPSLPRWLGATQVGHFADRVGLMAIVTSVAKHLSDPEFVKPFKPPQPVPELAVWVRHLNWNSHALEQFSSTLLREGFQPEVIPDGHPDEVTINRATKAALLIVSLDGTIADSLIHFISGAVVAKPNVGFGRSLKRRVIVLQEPSAHDTKFVAEGLRRFEDHVRCVTLDSLSLEVEKFCAEYRKWTNTAAKRRRKA